MRSIKLGFAPARRSIFSAPDAVEAEAKAKAKAKHRDRMICRFDGDNGEYSLQPDWKKGQQPVCKEGESARKERIE